MTRLETIRPIAAALLAARHRAQLSQRELGAKVGLAQSHLSKIERAAVDPQLSSLTEIARTLGLELMLVPVQLVPAVRALEREAVPDPRLMPSRIDQDLNRLSRHAHELTRRFPDIRSLPDVAAAAVELRIARLDESSAHEARSLIDAATSILQRLRGHSRGGAPIDEAALHTTAEKALTSTAVAIRELRNAWTHRDRSSPQTPAYRLDDSDA